MMVVRSIGLAMRRATIILVATVLLPRAATAGRDVWTPIGPPGSLGFNSAAFDPVDPSVVYLALQQWPLQSSNRGGGVAKSVDGGKTWRPVGEGLPADGVSFLWISPVDRALLFAATGAGYFRSEDGASSWTRLASPAGTDSCRQAVAFFCSPLSLSANDAETVYAADQAGIFKSIDAGRNWKKLTDPSPLAPGALHVEVDPSHPGHLYALTLYYGLLYRSTDDGQSWSVANGAILSGFGAFWISRNEPDVLFATNGREDLFYRSTDGGETWASLSSAGYRGNEVLDFVFPSGPAASVYAVTLGGVFRSADDGNSWFALPLSIRVPTDLYWAATSPADPQELIVGTPSDIVGSRDAGSTFVHVPRFGLPAGTVANALSIVRSVQSLLAAGTDTGLFVGRGDGSSRSSSLGGTRDILAVAAAGDTVFASFLVQNDMGIVMTGLSVLRLSDETLIDAGDVYPVDGGFDIVNTIVADPADSNTVYLGSVSGYGPSEGVFKSVDGGFIWSATGLSNVKVTALAIDALSPATLIAGASDGSIYRSSDGSATWTKTATLSGSVNAVLSDATLPGRIFAATDSGVFESGDAGDTWSNVSGSLQSVEVHALASGPRGSLLAGSDRGVFEMSLDGGPWQSIGTGPSVPQVLSLAYDEEGRRLFAGTAGGGVFEYSFATLAPVRLSAPVRILPGSKGRSSQ